MTLLDRVDVRPGAADLGILEPQTPIAQTRRDNPVLMGSLNEFATGFELKLEMNHSGAGPEPKPRFPLRHMNTLLELIESWGSSDKEVNYIGDDERGDPKLEHRLYRRERGEHVATITPHVEHNDEIVKVSSPDKLADLYQIISEIENRNWAESQMRMAAWERRRVEELAITGGEVVTEPAPASDQYAKANGTVKSGVKPVGFIGMEESGVS